jgi:hypothetical protein
MYTEYKKLFDTRYMSIETHASTYVHAAHVLKYDFAL